MVERKHMNIVDLGLTLLTQAYFPIPYWDYVFSTIIYLINWLPSSFIDFRVPYTLSFKTNPDYKFLRVFDCACFPLLRPYDAYKLDFRSHECFFLGYSTSHKGYMRISFNGRLYISKDILFNELRFPYLDFFTRLVPSLSPSRSLTLSPLPMSSPSLFPENQQSIVSSTSITESSHSEDIAVSGSSLVPVSATVPFGLIP